MNVRLERDGLWLSQRQRSLLFDKDTDTIGLHLRNIYGEGELEESATTEESSVVQVEGKRRVGRQVLLYNLDAVISVQCHPRRANADDCRKSSGRKGRAGAYRDEPAGHCG
ncbi:MAG: hypothetical protein ABIS17_02945 [Casimicrobiaceae bacterium]